ncbi:MAG: pyridoxamine 5'-phosphate oxidase family protein [Pseudomonadota bacterium]
MTDDDNTQTTDPFFHEGEIACQSEAGVDTQAYERLVSRHFTHAVRHSDVAMIAQNTFSVAATIDEQGRPWVSPLVAQSKPLFEIRGAKVIDVSAADIAGDPLVNNIRGSSKLGVLFLDLANRRRAKSMGSAQANGSGSIEYHIERYFGLCPKYIFRRRHSLGQTPNETSAQRSFEDNRLSEENRTQLAEADTVFLGSYSQHGPDATLRGGPRGFISTTDHKTLNIPDYLGNGMFNTLGNLRLDNRLALMNISFRTGETILITGAASVHEAPKTDELAVRTIQLVVDHVITTSVNFGEWEDLEEFPHAPGLVNPLTPMLS